MITNNVVLYDDEDYLVLNKPPDLRMDGMHLASVHKFVTYLYPPPSLLNKIYNQQEQGKNLYRDEYDHSNCIIMPNNETALVDAILKLSKHNDLKDNIVRPTHQLDYATSGVLLLAKSKQSAGIACKAFEERTTNKEYTALVRGHLHIHKKENNCSTIESNDQSHIHFPLLNPDQELLFEQWKDGRMEKNSKKEKVDIKGGRKKLFTFIGYVHANTFDFL